MPESERFKLREGISFLIEPSSRFGFEFFCFRSPQMRDEMDCFISQTKGCRCLVDIGAFHGVFSMAFCAQDAARTAYAFEPCPAAFLVLKQNASLNNFNIHSFQLATSSKAGEMPMLYEWGHVVSKSGFPKSEPITVSTTTVDIHCAEQGLCPDVIKVDVEGHEAKTLAGMAATMRLHKPVIFLELHPEHLALEGDSCEHLVSIIESAGYAAFDFNRERLSSLTDVRHCVLHPK